MEGRLIEYWPGSNEGVIAGDDGTRYTFSGTEWRNGAPLVTGMRVAFEGRGNQAFNMWPLQPSFVGAAPRYSKNRILAGVLGIFLGVLGIHKFYLGYTKAGIIMLLAGTIGLCLVIPAMASSAIGIVEGVIYLVKSDEEFEEEYVQQRKEWF